MKQLAYSLLTIKSVNDDLREIVGLATTPTPDRTGDIVEPKGAQFQLPIPLLWQHDPNQPVGEVYEARTTPEGIEIKARFTRIDEPGKLKDRLDDAWQNVKYKLVKGLSIGFKELEAARIEASRGYRYVKWLWLELSCVTIPANGEATITTIKSLDEQARRAASGHQGKPVVVLKQAVPGVSGQSQPTQGSEVKTIAEQIAAFEAKRAASVARMSEIMTKSGEEGRSLDEHETQEYDGLEAEVSAVDNHIGRLKKFESMSVKGATAVPGAGSQSGGSQQAGSEARGGVRSVEGGVEFRGGVIAVKPNVEKGIPFARYVKALAQSRGNLPGALAMAEANQHWKDTTPQVIEVLKAAVAAGDTVTPAWAASLVYNQNLAGEFIELLRPATIIGKIGNLTRVPFNVRMGGQDQGSSAYWVGQGKPVPVSKLNFMEVTLGIAKAAGLVVLTDELVRSSDPAAEMLVRNDLRDSIAGFLDAQFINPNFAAVANVSPGSITNGVTRLVQTGTDATSTRTDVQTLFSSYIAANVDITNAVWIMSPTRALRLSMLNNALGQPEFPTLSMTGGTFMGLPVVISAAANLGTGAGNGDLLVLVNAPDILFADDGAVTIDASREASIEMLDNPTNASVPGTPATTLVSMFQTNSVAIKAVRFVNWKKRRTTAVRYLSDLA